MAKVFVVSYEGVKYCIPGEACQNRDDVAASMVPGCKPGYNCFVSTVFTPPGMSAEEWIAQTDYCETTLPPEPPPPPQVFECPYCGAEFGTEGELYDHIENEHPEPPPPSFQCPYCSAVFNTAYQLELHIENEHPEPPPPSFQCPYCPAVFNTAGQLELHIENFHAEPPSPPPPVVFECPYCGAEFETEGELDQHIEDQHPTEPPPAEGSKVPWVLVGIGALATVGLVLASRPKSDRGKAGKPRS